MKQWNALAEKINQRNLRERIVLGLVVLSLVYFVVNIFLLAPLAAKKDELQRRMTLAQQEITKFSAQEKVLAQALTNDPNAAKKREVQRMEQRLTSIDNNLETLSSGLIAADKLPEVLHDVLNAKGTLSLLAMETQAPSRLRLQTESAVSVADSEAAENTEAQDTTEENIGVFKHSVYVSLEGRYFDVIAYLQALEALPWKFYWEAIDYQVKDYPKAKILIEVYTLSTEAGILSV